jgi:hypothetical protein
VHGPRLGVDAFKTHPRRHCRVAPLAAVAVGGAAATSPLGAAVTTAHSRTRRGLVCGSTTVITSHTLCTVSSKKKGGNRLPLDDATADELPPHNATPPTTHRAPAVVARPQTVPPTHFAFLGPVLAQSSRQARHALCSDLEIHLPEFLFRVPRVLYFNSTRHVRAFCSRRRPRRQASGPRRGQVRLRHSRVPHGRRRSRLCRPAHGHGRRPSLQNDRQGASS